MHSLLRLMAAAALMITANHAQATDFSRPATWSGFYAGLHGGHGNFDLSFPQFPDATDLFNDGKGALAGVQLGYNFQPHANWVLGGEMDFSGSLMKSSLAIGDPTDLLEMALKLESLASLRGRVGITIGNALLYGTAGYAIAKARYNEKYTDDNPFTGALEVDIFSGRATARGAVYGGGLDWLATERTMLRLELLYYDLSADLPVASDQKVKTEYDAIVGRIGLNFLLK